MVPCLWQFMQSDSISVGADSPAAVEREGNIVSAAGAGLSPSAKPRGEGAIVSTVGESLLHQQTQRGARLGSNLRCSGHRRQQSQPTRTNLEWGSTPDASLVAYVYTTVRTGFQSVLEEVLAVQRYCRINVSANQSLRVGTTTTF